VIGRFLIGATGLKRLLRTRAGRIPPYVLAGAVVVILIVALAAVAPLVAPYRPEAFAIRVRLQAPSAEHWFGTDEYGRDVLSRVLFGARYSLAIGFGATLISLVVGVPLGLLAAFFSNWVGGMIMRGVDLLMSVPPILIGLLVMAISQPGLLKTIVIVGIAAVPSMVRVTRSVALGLLQEDFVEAARSQGEGSFHILAREILPNASPPIMVESGLRVTFAILLGSSLSFLGLGPQPPASEWGLMISDSRAFVTSAPWIALAPGLSLCVLLIAVNIVGEGLREMLDPRLRGRGDEA